MSPLNGDQRRVFDAHVQGTATNCHDNATTAKGWFYGYGNAMTGEVNFQYTIFCMALILIVIRLTGYLKHKLLQWVTATRS